ncbi:MAG: hypothetical protein CME32_22435 [Gimesia sp.]|nr:hypothetical protein [Gimesia sp.]
MEAQIENAVGILENPYSDGALKSQAFEYLEQLRTDPSGWQTCITIFVRTPRSSEVLRLVCLEIVNYAVHTQGLDGQSLTYLRDTLSNTSARLTAPSRNKNPTLLICRISSPRL